MASYVLIFYLDNRMIVPEKAVRFRPPQGKLFLLPWNRFYCL